MSNVEALKGNALKDGLQENPVIQPGTGFTAQPGVRRCHGNPRLSHCFLRHGLLIRQDIV